MIGVTSQMTIGHLRAFATNGQRSPEDWAKIAASKIVSVSDSATTNWLLMNAPDVYLWAAMAEAAQATGDSSLWQEYETRLGVAIDKLKVFDRRASYSGATLRVRPRPQNLV
jgi:hypothetical protein